MSFSLYGDLPKPKSAKGDNAKGPEGTADVAKAWAAVAPAPTPSNQEPTPAPVDSTKPSGTVYTFSYVGMGKIRFTLGTLSPIRSIFHEPIAYVQNLFLDIPLLVKQAGHSIINFDQ